MKGKTTFNDYLVYTYCVFCIVWSIYILFF